jgi:hypothetical protein
MSKSIKLKNNYYLDSTGIVHNKEKLSDIISRIGTGVYSLRKSTRENMYVDFNIGDINNERKVYLYLGISNGVMLYAGVFSFCTNDSVGKIYYHTKIAGDATISVNDDNTIRFYLSANWGEIVLLGNRSIS